MDYTELIYWWLIPLIIIAFYYKKSLASLLCIYVLCSSIFVIFNPASTSPNNQKVTTIDRSVEPPKYIEVMSRDVLRIQSAMAIIVAIITVMFALKMHQKAAAICAIACVIGCAVIIYNKLFSEFPIGICLNTSVDGTLMAILSPFYYSLVFSHVRKKYWPIVILPIVAAILTGSSIGVGGTSLAFAIYLFLKFKNSMNNKLLAALSLTAFASVMKIAHSKIGEEMLSDTNRIATWKWSMQWFFEQDYKTILFGTGYGTYWAYGPYIQIVKKLVPNKEIFTFMHNDWLELLFELGAVGFALAMLVYICALIRAKTAHLQTALIITGIVSFMNFPLKHVVSGIFVFLIITSALTSDKKLVR